MMKKKIYSLLVVLALTLISSLNAFAQDYDLGNILVSATKTQQYQSQVGSATTIITQADIAKSGKATVAEILQDAPGVAIRKNSNFGGLTSIDIRGAKSGQTMVLIDGVEVYDPIAIDRDFNFAHLAADNIEQIEIVRGPQSTLYGANAMAGVINIITKKGEGVQKVDVLVEAGSYDTFRESLGISGASENTNYSFFVSRVDSDGVSKARDSAELDAYKSTAVSSRLGTKVFDEAELFLVARYTDSEFETDDSFPIGHDDVNRVNFSEQFSSKVGLQQTVNENWEHIISFSFIDMFRRDRDPVDSTDTTENDDSTFRGDVKKFEWQHNIALTGNDTQTIGYDYQEERGTSNVATSWPSRLDRRSIQNRGYYFQSQLEPLEDFYTSAGARIDDHDIFGSEVTYKLSASYLIKDTATRLKTNYGTAFKAPSVFQLYDGTNGNASLGAEKSLGYDFGIEQKFNEDKMLLGATYFKNKFKNLIEWVEDSPGAWTGKYTNIKKATTRGIELETYLQVIDALKLGGNYTFTLTKDKDTGNEFGRRPKNQASAYLDWAYSDKGNINLAGRYVGARYNTNANTVKIKSQIVFDLASSYDIAKEVQAFWRVENILDREYELISGFDGLGRSIYTGVKAEF